MTGTGSLLLLLHIGAMAALLAALAAPRWRRHAGAASMFCAASLLLLLKWGGWWLDMPSKIATGGLLLLLPFAAFLRARRARSPLLAGMARSATAAGCFLYAGFFLTVGVQAFRHGTPLSALPAADLLGLGVLLLLAGWLEPAAAVRPASAP